MMGQIKLSKLKLEVIDESISNGVVQLPVLYLTLDQHQVLYSIYDQSREKFIALRDYHIFSDNKNALEEIVQNDEFLSQLHFHKVVVGIYTIESTIVPAPLYHSEYAKDALRLTTNFNEYFTVNSDKLYSCDAYHVYGIDEELLKTINRNFSGCTVINAKTCFISQVLKTNKHASDPIVNVNVRQQEMDIVINNGNELIYTNSFNYGTGEDFIYFLLFAMEQLNLNPDQVAVILYGELDKNSSAWLATYKYVRNCSFGEKIEGLQFSYGFNKLNVHQYFNLFSLNLCE